jgi:prohibitin 2
MSKFDPRRDFMKDLKKMTSNAGKNGPKFGAGFGLLTVASLVGLGLYSSIYRVEGGFKAIKFNRFTGVGSTVYPDGINFLIPFIERPIIFDVRSNPESITSLTGSKDLQMVDLTVRVLYKPDQTKLQKIYRELGMNYGERVLPSIGNEVLKSVVAQFTAAELLTKRSDVSQAITDRLRVRAGEFGVLIDDVSLINLGFGKEYTHAVEKKQVAQQESEQAKFLVTKALQEKQATIIKAQGEAVAAELIGKAMAENQGYLEIKRIEQSIDIAEILSKGQNKVILPSDFLIQSNLPK